MIRPVTAFVLLLLSAFVCSAHRLDEYLQGTMISLEPRQVRIEMTLTPGVAVFPSVFAQMDTDGNGTLSKSEQYGYAEKVRRDVTLAIDGRQLSLSLVSLDFSEPALMKEGIGNVILRFEADLPGGGEHRVLQFGNRHLSGLSVYQVNLLAPESSSIRVEQQKRDYFQSSYELDYTQTMPAATTSYSSAIGPSAALLGVAGGWVFLLLRRPRLS